MLWSLGFLINLSFIFDLLQTLSNRPSFDFGAARSQFRALDHLTCHSTTRFSWQISPGAPLRGEGCVTSMGDMRAGIFSSFGNIDDHAKTHGMEPRQISGSYQTDLQREVCKRSFKRARQRASLHGITWYKGRMVTASQLGVTLQSPKTVTPIKNVAPPTAMKRKRLSCFSWNCNGLPPAHWDFLMQWLDNQMIDILLLQETHWPFSRDWIDGKYMMVHSGSQSKQAGLLCMVSTRVCSPADLTWYEHLPGRVLQLRIHGPSRCIDILNIYQYTCVQTHMDQRSQVWNMLFSILSGFSRRNILLLAGDLNCSADQRSSAVGYPDFRRDGCRSLGPRHPDANHWKQLVVQFDLMALNTWNSQDTATYEFGHHCSRIDYICTRRTHADPLARDVKQLHDFSLVPLSGAFHIPLLTSIRREWFHAQTSKKLGWTRQQRLRLSQHCVKQDDTFHCFQQQINRTIYNLHADQPSDLNILHSTLNKFTCNSFLQTLTKTKPVTDTGPFRIFQEHTWQLRHLHGHELATLFQAWFHVCKRSQARRAMSAAAKQKRKLRLDQVFHAADLAEKAHDHFTLFQHIRTLAPKQPMKQIMLRSDKGELLGPDDAADWLQRWYHELYSDGDSNFLISDFMWPFTQEEFTLGLQSLPVHKALAPAFTPAPFWKYGAAPISQYLDQMFHDCCANRDFPDIWGTGTIAMLVKPGKSGRHPSELRPIALLEPTGKTVMGLLTTAIQKQIQPFMNRLPQFAYAAGRGTEDAIHRLAEHCRLVRNVLKDFSHPIHSLKQGQELPHVIGGMTLCLDLTRAFDTVNRQRLFQSLERLEVSHDLISLLKCVHNKTQYEFTHRGAHRSVQTRRGIRQGCRAAPCLWSVFISTLMMDIEQHISPQFLLMCITIFADDICSHKMFDSEESFIALIKSFGILLDLIEGADLDINLAKTTVTLRMKRKLVGKIQRRFFVRTHTGTFIKIPRSNGTHTKIRLVRSFKYLGVMLSYYNFEAETMALRLKHSKQTGHQLHRWLYTQRMSFRQRVKLWYQCVYTCLRYGIIATGFTEPNLLHFFRFSIKQLRRILRDPVHLSHENNSSFLHRHDLPDPLLRLRDICLQTAHRLLARQRTLAADDILHLTPLPCYDQLLQVITKVYEQVHFDTRLTEVPDPLLQFVCSTCAHGFTTLAALRRHQTVAHGHRSGMLRLVNSQPQTDIPTCPRCGAKFGTWARFRYHTMYVCQHELQEIDQVEHRLRVQELLQFARAHQVAALRNNPTVLLYFLHHCALCGKFHSTITGLMRHWNDDHNESYKEHLPVLQHYTKHVDTGNPCVLCSTSFSQYHRCIIWRQLAMLLTETQMTAEYCDITEREQLHCDHCGKAYTTRHGLAQHIQKFHNAQQVLHANNWERFTAKCLFDQAVQTNRCEDLISDPDILHFISSECLDCSMPFRRRQDLSRHLKQGHPSEWAEMEQRAADLTTSLSCVHRCLCEPPQHRAKHLCLVFLQFALARILWEREQSPAADGLPPDLALKPQEKMEQLLWFGFGHLLYRQPALKLALTLHCQFCGYTCRSGDNMVLHLHQHHEALVAESSIQLQLLRWVYFQSFGCACNPTRGFGVPDHICPALIQAAMFCVQAHWPLTIPWEFKTGDLLSHIGDLLPLHDFRRICLWLLTRQFGNLWRDPALLNMLKHHCTICGEAVSLQYITVHLHLEHQLGANDLHPIVVQLCRIFSAEHSEDPCCDHCGELLPTMDVLSFDPVPELHLPGCPLILHLAAFLMHPGLAQDTV